MAADVQSMLSTANALTAQVNALTGGGATGTTANAAPTAAATTTTDPAAAAAAGGGDAVAQALALGLDPSALSSAPISFNYSSISDSIKSIMAVVSSQSKVVAAKQALLAQKARDGNLDPSEVALLQIENQITSSLSQQAQSVNEERRNMIQTWLR